MLALHDAKQYEEAIALIEAALIRGESEPWMYQVLALAMKLAGRPQADIERVLFSTVDYTTIDVPSMLVSAAYLTRLQANKPALALYQQASRLAPVRPEPYLLGMRIAVLEKDWEAAGWGATGVVSYAWTPDFKKLHAEAEGVAGDAARELKKQGKRLAAEKLAKAMVEARQRDLVVKVSWSGNGDLDLLVEEPNGTTCSYRNTQTNGGGFLVHEGHGPDQSRCYEEYVCPVAAPGEYKLRIRYSNGEIVGKRASVEVIRYAGSKRESKKVLPIQLESDDSVVTVPLPFGRAKKKGSGSKPRK